jgi:hypothetical protein
MLIKLSYPAKVIGVQSLIHAPRHHVQSKQRIAADFFDEHDQGPSQTSRRFNELTTFQQVIAAAGEVKVPTDGLASLRGVHHGQITIAGIFGHRIVNAGMLHRHP